MSTAARPSNEAMRESFLGEEMSPSRAKSKSCSVNVGPQERAISAAAGAAMVLIGLTRGPFRGFMLSALGAGLLYRGLSGDCQMYRALDVDTSKQG